MAAAARNLLPLNDGGDSKSSLLERQRRLELRLTGMTRRDDRKRHEETGRIDLNSSYGGDLNSRTVLSF
jgi:hypothetical protein